MDNDNKTMLLDEVIETGMFLLEDTDDEDMLCEMLDSYIRDNYEEDGVIYLYSSKDMCRILYTAFRYILIEIYDISTNDKGIILDAILLFNDK